MSQQIPLGKGHVTLVDDDVYMQIKSYHWFLSATGYAVGLLPVEGKFQLVYLHRYVMKAGPGELVDHINGANKLDNRRSNLRLATPQQNHQNRRPSNLSYTKLKGVGWHKRRCKYHARIQLQGIRYHLGFFDSPEMAALAYDFAARALFGEFCHCNYPDEKTVLPRKLLDNCGSVGQT